MQATSENAIQAALRGKWTEAVDLNAAILRENPNELEALNRLARAYAELGEIAKADSTYRKVLVLDKYNPIAIKNLKRLKAKRPKSEGIVSQSNQTTPPISANFLEE